MMAAYHRQGNKSCLFWATTTPAIWLIRSVAHKKCSEILSSHWTDSCLKRWLLDHFHMRLIWHEHSHSSSVQRLIILPAWAGTKFATMSFQLTIIKPHGPGALLPTLTSMCTCLKSLNLSEGQIALRPGLSCFSVMLVTGTGNLTCTKSKPVAGLSSLEAGRALEPVGLSADQQMLEGAAVAVGKLHPQLATRPLSPHPAQAAALFPALRAANDLWPAPGSCTIPDSSGHKCFNERLSCEAQDILASL